MMAAWQPVTRGRVGLFSLGLAILIFVILSHEPGYVPILDDANLLFHEAGHVFFGLLGGTLGLYGGTLGQFVFPLMVAAEFWRQRLPVAFAAGCIWFFENLLNVARYVADARARVLPLVGGGEHDWFQILGRWHLLPYDTCLAALLRTAAWAGLAATWCWLAWQAHKTAARLDGDRN